MFLLSQIFSPAPKPDTPNKSPRLAILAVMGNYTYAAVAAAISGLKAKKLKARA